MKGSGFFKQERELQKATIFSNIFRLIDDLCTFNKNEFENNYINIYPDELELKKENKAPCKASFFDLLKEVYERKLTNDLFDERHAFPFYINRIVYLDNNMPSTIY